MGKTKELFSEQRALDLAKKLIDELKKSGVREDYTPVASIYDSYHYGVFLEWSDQNNYIATLINN